MRPVRSRKEGSPRSEPPLIQERGPCLSGKWFWRMFRVSMDVFIGGDCQMLKSTKSRHQTILSLSFRSDRYEARSMTYTKYLGVGSAPGFTTNGLARERRRDLSHLICSS